MTRSPQTSVAGLVSRAAWLASMATFAGVRLAASIAFRGRQRRASLCGEHLAQLLERLGPTYIKVGQLLSTRSDLLSTGARVPLTRLQDQVRCMPTVMAEQIIRSELGADLATQLTGNGLRPIAGASVASVFHATLLSGANVAIKVQNPDTARQIHVDLKLLVLVAAGLSRLPILRRIPVRETIDQLVDLIQGQLDFKREARNCRTLGTLMPSDQILIPIVMDDYSTASLITMEFLPEASGGSELLSLDLTSSVETATRALYAMIFVAGLVHCDLHPGNLKLLGRGRIAIVDFGLFAELDVDDRGDFAEFFVAMADDNGARCAEIAMSKASYRSLSFDAAAFTDDVKALISQNSGRRPGDFQVAGFVARLIDLQRRHGLRSTTGFTQALIALLVFEGTVKAHTPKLDFQGLARPFILPALLRADRHPPEKWMTPPRA